MTDSRELPLDKEPHPAYLLVIFITLMMRLRTFLPAILCGSVSILLQTAHSATFTWGGSTGNWNTGTSWVGNTVPPSNPATDLVFGGDIVGGLGWTSSNNIPSVPFILNQMLLQGTDSAFSGGSHTISGNALRFVGADAEIRQAGAANMVINTPVQFDGALLFSGDGASTVTINAGVSGVGDITKTGDNSTFRFGTIPGALPPAQVGSDNTWMGRLLIEGGTVRFNNNAQAASSALRSNPVVFTGAGILTSNRDGGDETDGFNSSLRMGTLSDEFGIGSVVAAVSGSNTSNYDIVISALENGSYAGGITLPSPTGLGNDGGDLVLRGPGTQTLRGNLSIWKDTVVGHGSTMVLAGGASLHNTANAGSGSVTLAGGTLRLDNTATPFTLDNGRLRNGDAGSTSVDTIGGGKLQMIGEGLNTHEVAGRLQLGASDNPRSGHLKIEVSAANGTTVSWLSFASYARNTTIVQQLATVDFTATTGSTTVPLASATRRISLGTPTLSNNLLSSNSGPASVGWATVTAADGPYFATHGANGVIAAATTLFSTWSANPSATTNVRLIGAATTAGTGLNQPMNSLRISGSGGATTLNIGADTLSTTAILLAGGIDYAIQATSAGRIAGDGPRFFHVQSANLTVEPALTGSAQPVVKSGDGTLTLTGNNSTLNEVVAINSGSLRATPGTSLPQGEIRLRGGQLEIQGGGTFSRSLGFGANTINWSGVQLTAGQPNEVDQDRGSGGFAAVGADVNIDLDGAGPTLISWEGLGFARSGYALTFGSGSATHRVTWTDHLSLSAADPTVVNYNAREIQVLKNPSPIATDSARITGTISGRQTNDLLKTGAGDLELTASNTYSGATIVHQGRLFVNGNSTSSFLHKAMPGGTLAGKGTVGNVLVDAGGIIAPGMAAGVASILTTKDLQFTDATSKFQFEIGGTVAGGDSVAGYDQIRVDDLNAGTNVTLELNGASLEGTFLNGFLAGVQDIFFLILNDGTDAVVGQFAQGNQVTIGSQNFNISYTANSDTGLFSGGNDVALQLVPEPSAALLLGLGALLGARRRRPQA